MQTLCQLYIFYIKIWQQTSISNTKTEKSSLLQIASEQSDGSKRNFRNKPKFPHFSKNFPTKMDRPKLFCQTMKKIWNSSLFQNQDWILKIWVCKFDGNMSSILSILDQFSSCLFSMCLARKNSTLQYKLLHLFLEFFTILKDSTKLPMFMFSADSQCLSKELWSTVSTIGSSMPYSTLLNSTYSRQDITTLLLVLQDFVELGLSLSSLTTNAIRFWVISDEVQRKRPIKSTKMLQKQEKFLMDMALALFPVPTISGKLLDG